MNNKLSIPKSSKSSNNIRTSLLIITDKEIKKLKPKSYFTSEDINNLLDDCTYVHINENFTSPSRKGQKSFTYKPISKFKIPNTINQDSISFQEFKIENNNLLACNLFSETASPFNGSFSSEKEIDNSNPSRRNSNSIDLGESMQLSKSSFSLNENLNRLFFKKELFDFTKSDNIKEAALKSSSFLKNVAKSAKAVVNLKNPHINNNTNDLINSLKLNNEKYGNNIKKFKTENIKFLESKFSNNTINFQKFKFENEEKLNRTYLDNSYESNTSSISKNDEHSLINIIPCDES